MARTLIFSDIHLRHAQIDEILEFEGDFDRVVFLGDYFDNRNDTPEMNAATAIWLKNKMKDPRFVFLVGNHDWQYLWPDNGFAECGISKDKAVAVRKHITFDELLNLRPYYVEQGILLTHAGVDNLLPQLVGSAGFETPKDFTIAGVTKWIDDIWPSVLTRYQANSVHPLIEPDVIRGGYQKIGGIIWRDFQNLNPIPKIGQVVGHTTQDKHNGPLMRMINSNKIPMWKFTLNPVHPQWLVTGWALGLDTVSNHYIILENETIQINKVKREKSMADMQVYSTRIIPFRTIDLSQYYKCQT